MADQSNEEIEISAISAGDNLNQESAELFEEGEGSKDITFHDNTAGQDDSKETGPVRSSLLSTQDTRPSLRDALERDIVFLTNNEIPKDVSGLKMDVLDYRGNDSDILVDEDVLRLSSAFKRNKVFAGEILLSRNALTDQGAHYICDGTAHLDISKLDLSQNALKERAGIRFGETLKSNTTLRGLYFNGAHMEKDGVQRLCEALSSNETLIALDLGVVQSSGLEAIGKYLKHNRTLQHLWIQEDPRYKWTETSKEQLLATLRDNTSLLSLTTKTTFHDSHVDLIGEINAICEYNREQFLKRAERTDREENIDPLVYGLKLKKLSEHRGSAQNLPVRSYLKNALGPLVIDAIVELGRYRRKAGAQEENNAVNNIRFIGKYLIERKHEKFV